jgi:hypothetical protein
MQTNPADYPIERNHHRMIAPRHLCGTSLQFSDSGVIQIPWNGIVEIASSIEHPSDEPVEGQWPRPIFHDRTHRVKELLQLGFRHLPAAGTTDQRPPQGRYPGEQFFDETLRKPVWWDGAGSWRDALGAPALGGPV